MRKTYSTDFSDAGEPFPYDELIPRTLLEPAGIPLLPDTLSHLGLIYSAPPGFRPLRLDLHLPMSADRPVPLVVYVHGGSFIGGVPEMGPWMSLPPRGIAVAALSYRLAGEATFPAPVDDIQAGLSWLQAHRDRWGLDSQRFGLWGSSAGGYLAGIAAVSTPATVPSVTAVICHYPLTDPRRLHDDALPSGLENAQRLHRITQRFCPQQLAVSDCIDPSEIPPPFLIVHGTDDHRVGPAQSQRLHDSLLASGARSSLRLVRGADHGSSEFFTAEAGAAAASFLEDVWDRR